MGTLYRDCREVNPVTTVLSQTLKIGIAASARRFKVPKYKQYFHKASINIAWKLIVVARTPKTGNRNGVNQGENGRANAVIPPSRRSGAVMVDVMMKRPAPTAAFEAMKDIA